MKEDDRKPVDIKIILEVWKECHNCNEMYISEKRVGDKTVKTFKCRCEYEAK